MVNPLVKYPTLFCLLLAISSIIPVAPASCSELRREIIPFCFSEPLFEIKTGYFFFSDSKMRKVYDRDGLDIQLCSSYLLWNLTSRWSLNAYGAIEYFHRSGNSMNGDQKTSVWSVPINMGLRPVYTINANMQYYFSLGPRYFYIQQRNRSPYVYKNKSRNGVGFFINTGFDYALGDHFLVDIFGEYSYAKTQFHGGNPRVYTRKIQVGGFTFGGGIGYSF